MSFPSKRDARSWARRQRQPTTPDVSRRIGALLLSLIDASVVYAYAPDLARGELGLSPAMAELNRRGTATALPRITGPQALAFHAWSPGDELIVHARYGIGEPAPTSPLAPPPDAILLPGLAADPSGGRLGYGGGFYDALLARHPDALRIFPIASSCVTPELPSEAHDARVDVIVTERFCLWTHARDLSTVQPGAPPAVSD